MNRSRHVLSWKTHLPSADSAKEWIPGFWLGFFAQLVKLSRMKFPRMPVLLLLLALATQARAYPDDDTLKLPDIVKRFDAGDNNALLEITSTMDPNYVVNALYLDARFKYTSPAQSKAVREAVMRVNGVEEALRQRIVVASPHLSESSAWERIGCFNILQILATKKAVAAIAFFLYDDKTPTYADDCVFIQSNKAYAAALLCRMDLPDKPAKMVNFGDAANAQEGIEQWRSWWDKHKAYYTPVETSPENKPAN